MKKHKNHGRVIGTGERIFDVEVNGEMVPRD